MFLGHAGSCVCFAASCVDDERIRNEGNRDEWVMGPPRYCKRLRCCVKAKDAKQHISRAAQPFVKLSTPTSKRKEGGNMPSGIPSKRCGRRKICCFSPRSGDSSWRFCSGHSKISCTCLSICRRCTMPTASSKKLSAGYGTAKRGIAPCKWRYLLRHCYQQCYL